MAVNGYDERQVWDLCVEQGRSTVGVDQVIEVAEFSPAAVRTAFDGIGVQVVVDWVDGLQQAGKWAGAYFGPQASPVLRAFERPHASS